MRSRHTTHKKKTKNIRRKTLRVSFVLRVIGLVMFFYAIPLAAAFLAGNDPLVSIAIVTGWFCVLTLGFTMLSGNVRRFFAALVTTYYLGIFLSLLFLVFMGDKPDTSWIFDAPELILPTIGTYLDPWMTVAASAALLVALVAGGLSLSVIHPGAFEKDKIVRRRKTAMRVTALFVLCGTLTANAPLHSLSIETPDAQASVLPPGDPTQVIPRYSVPSATTRENVVILQLESLNALAVGGKAIVKDRAYPGNFIPEMTKMARDGTLFRWIWGSSVQTNRALETIICGVVGNIGKAYSVREGQTVVGKNCLPSLLAQAGYRTIVYRSDDLGFANMGGFLKVAGFQQVSRNDIMKREDTEYKWGFDDCTFYKRALSDLKNRDGDEPFFAYIEVSSHHAPYVIKPGYEKLAPFPVPDKSRLIESYLNSEMYQDHCLGEFYAVFKKTYAADTHLIVLGDHSIPLGINRTTSSAEGSTTDNFLLPMAIVPALTRDDVERGRTIDALDFGESDVFPTVLELVSGQPVQNSLVPVLRKNVDPAKATLPLYERCHLSVQPFSGGHLSVYRNGKKRVYHVTKQTVDESDLHRDILDREQNQIARSVSLEEFQKDFYCDRHQ